MLTNNSTFDNLFMEGDLMTIFGKQLKELRKIKHITQRELANKIDVDFSYISKIETGALDPPSEELIIKIAKVLGVDSEELILSAKKVPSNFKELIIEEDIASLFLREIPNMSLEKKEKIKRIIVEEE